MSERSYQTKKKKWTNITKGEENKIKPKITKKIEETDGGLTAEQAAAGLLTGRGSLNSRTI